MSNFIRPAFDPVAGVVRDATWIDDYFGPHQYGVQFDAGGPVYRPDQASTEAAGEWIADLRSKLAAAEAEIELLKKQVIGLAEMQAEEWEHIECDACAPLRTRAEAAEAREAQMREALEIIAGKRQCIDNLMGNVDVAEWALKHTQPSDYRERVRGEERERCAKVADDIGKRNDAASIRASNAGRDIVASHRRSNVETAIEIASAIRALGDSNANG